MYATLLILTSLLFSQEEIPDGTLFFVEGGNQLVMDYTESPYSHVAIIFNEENKPYVYEAIRPVCQKISLEDYIKKIELENSKKHKQMKLWIRKPLDLSKEDAEKMKQYCEQQLGRKYKIKSYFSEQEEKTIHCAEMTARAMLAGGMDFKENPCSCSPKDIMNFCSKWYVKARML
jgi:hypothetical protein